MNGQKTETKVSSQRSSTTTSVSPSSNSISHKQRILQTYLLIWIDPNFDQSKQDYQHILQQLQNIIHDIRIFVEWNQAIDFITDHEHLKAIFLITYQINLHLSTVINDIQQIDSVYILSSNDSQCQEWTTESNKLKGVYTDIMSICHQLQPTIKQYNQNSISVSIVTPNEGTTERNLNELEPLFMYTQIFKEIFLEMTHDKQSINTFISFWRQHNSNNAASLKVIDEFEHNYCPQSSIRWYTREYFIYQMLNQALRTLDSDTLIHMGFFIHDLHKQTKELHQKQVRNYDEKVFTVYRGQGLSKQDFDKLVKSKGGLMSFNSFLSTSKKRSVSLLFAESAPANADTIGILFHITIDCSVSSAPFASIETMSCFEGEEEILFSMHSVFRIHDITNIPNKNALYQVNLTLTADDDEQLRTLTNQIRKETGSGTGWQRIGILLLKIGEVNKAEELYNILLEQTFDEKDKSIYFNNLGYIKNEQGDHSKAIGYHRQALEIKQKTLPPNHPDLASSYSNIGTVYRNMGEYVKALSFLEKTLEMEQKSLPPNHPSLATSYNNIAGVYDNMGEYVKALAFYEKALEMRQKTLPSNHPDLAASYNNIGMVYNEMGEYVKALAFYEKTLEMQQKSLPSNHPSLATSYNNIAIVYQNMGEYVKALAFYEKALEMRQKTLPSNHPDLAASYNNIGMVYNEMGKYVKALAFLEKALVIFEKSFPPNHPSLATSYSSIAGVYYNMGEYVKALGFYGKALEMRQKTLPPNHPSLATSYNNIGMVYDNMGEYVEALSVCEKALEIFEKSLPPNHPSLAASYQNIGMVYYNMKDYVKALAFCEKALEIQQKTLPPNHPSLATSYNNIGIVYNNMAEYMKALAFYEKALEMRQKTLSPNHPDLAASYNNIGMVYNEMGEYVKALAFYEKALVIFEKSFPPNRPDLATSYNNIAILYYKMGEYFKAFSYVERALNIFQTSLPSNHPHIQTVLQSLEIIKKKL